LLGNKVRLQLPEAEYTVFYKREGQEVAGLAIEAAGRGGYGGDIVIMIGVDRAAGQMLGVEIVTHGETPGVGALVEGDGFRSQWQGLDARAQVDLRGGGGQIDAITGATFSSRAMIDGTNQMHRRGP
jgi:electron transport complex protein RnfG